MDFWKAFAIAQCVIMTAYMMCASPSTFAIPHTLWLT
jgi:hypothetical protein